MGIDISSRFEYGPEIPSGFPDASHAIVYVIAVGTDVEMGWASILASISGTERALAVTLLRSVRNVTNQADAVIEVGKQQLGENDARILQALKVALEAHRIRRNDFAHHVWAKSPAIPDAILLLKPQLMVDRFTWALPRNRPVQGSDLALIVDDSCIYRAPQFQLVVKEAEAARAAILAAQQYFIARYLVPRNELTDLLSEEMLKMLRANSAFDAQLKKLEANAAKRPPPATPLPAVEFALKYRRPDGTFVAIVRDLPYHVVEGDAYFERCRRLAAELGDALPFEPPPAA